MKVLRATGTVFIVLGAVILFFVVYELLGTSLQTRAHQSALREQFADLLDDPVVPVATPGATPSATPSPRAKRPPIRGIAQIQIPRIGVDRIVVEGVSLSVLGYGPGRYPDSADIGAKGVTAIAGHRTGWGSPFINLDKLSAGDEIILRTAQATYTYRVTRSDVVVKPTDYWVIKGDPNSKAPSKLTLTTCTPKYTSKNRLIVWADLVQTVPRASAA